VDVEVRRDRNEGDGTMTFAELVNEITVATTEEGREQAVRSARNANENQYAAEIRDDVKAAADGYVRRAAAIYDATHPAGWANR
jgi:hypothetical protein